jgi:ABC-2 type transport system permease protein
MVAVGYAVGFRFDGGVAGAIGMILLATLLGLAVCSVSALIGLAVKDEESVQAFGLIWVFPLTFVSAAFVPIASMPSWLQGFARHQPFTVVIETLRILALGAKHAAVGMSLGTALWESIAWTVGILVVFVPLATRAYKRA